MKKNTRKYFGTDGVRGRVGESPITPDFVMRLGHAAGKVLAAGQDLPDGEHAAVLIGKYRSNPTGQPVKLEAISAEESKLILKALAEGDFIPGSVNATVPGAMELFNQLGITVNDGYKLDNVRNQQNIAQAMQKWLSENTGKYVIKKLVADPNAKGLQQDVQPVIRPGFEPGIRPAPPIRIQPGQLQPAPVPVPERR